MKAKFCGLTVLRKMFYFIILLIFRAIRRQSLSEIGFGRLDTYTKLDKLGEVNTHFTFTEPAFFVPLLFSKTIGKILQNSNIEIFQFYIPRFIA